MDVTGNKSYYKSVILLIITLLFPFSGLLVSYAQYSGEIISLTPHNSKFINYGPVLVNDSLTIKFLAKNTGSLPLRLEPRVPSFYLGLSPNDATAVQWERFSRDNSKPELPKIFENDTSDTLHIKFIARDTLISRTGWHEALFCISFLPGDSDSETPISKIDTFFLRVKKTPYYVAGFDDLINFDSVYVNPNSTNEKIWRVKNVRDINQAVDELKGNLITQPFSDREFIIPDLPASPLSIYPDSIIYLNLKYHPLNRGKDSMFLKLNYQPFPVEFPDSIDFAWTALRGIGVEQELNIHDASHNWYNDTIKLGNVKLGETVKLLLTINNDGNLPFGIKSQAITGINDDSANDFSIVTPFLANGMHLQANEKMFTEIHFTPSDIGTVSAKLRLESDILDRNIVGTQPDKRYEYFYIQANVISPKIVLQTNEVDMGNIILTGSDCPSQRDTVLHIFNSGNANLEIYSVLTNPHYPESNFYPSRQSIVIPPGSSDTLTIQFRAEQGEFNNFFSDIIILTNQYPPFDSIVVSFRAATVPPVSVNLSIPKNIRAKPGTMLELPIILNADDIKPARLARNFRASLIYNRSLLEFVGFISLGTASEGSLNHGDNFEIPESDELNLDIRAGGLSYFLPKDTLIILRFRTYLGNSVRTEISILEPKFGDGKCDNILNLINISGDYTIDSVCGINYKAIPSTSGNFSLEISGSENFAEHSVSASIPYSCNVKISILNLNGQIVHEMLNQNMPAGKYSFPLESFNLKSGLYAVLLETPAVRLVKPFPVVK
ncbi:MAG: choice-of-anchor D domain-containing protein [Candidatus Kapaibacterium sp.]